MKPHRGTTILTLGILGIIVLSIFAPFAWVMGKKDLAQIAAGNMDPEGESMTRLGMVCGIIGTILFIVGMVLVAVLLVLYWDHLVEIFNTYGLGQY